MASSRRAGTNTAGVVSPGAEGAFESGANSFGTAGAGRDYTSLTQWETDTDVNLTSQTLDGTPGSSVSPTIECYDDAASFETTVYYAGASNTSSSYFRRITVAATARHNGVPGAGVKFTGPSAAGYCFGLGEAYFHLHDVEVAMSVNNATNGMCVQNLGASYQELVGLLLTATNAGSGVHDGIQGVQNNITRVINCIAYECEGNGIRLRHASSLSYNNTSVHNTLYGYQYTTAEPIYKNSLAEDNGSGDWNTSGGGSGTDYNTSGDGDSTAPGTNHWHEDATYTDESGNTWTLAAATPHAGTNLSADATFAFDDDIAYNTRSTWDIGASEYVSSVTPLTFTATDNLNA